MKQGDLETNKEMKVGSWNRDQVKVTLPKLDWESKDIDIEVDKELETFFRYL